MKALIAWGGLRTDEDPTINRERTDQMAHKVLKFRNRRTKLEVKNLLQAIHGIKARDDDDSVPFLKKEDLFRDRPSNFVLQ